MRDCLGYIQIAVSGSVPASHDNIRVPCKGSHTVYRTGQIDDTIHQRGGSNHHFIGRPRRRAHLRRIVPQRQGQIVLKRCIILRINTVCQLIIIIAGIADKRQHLAGIGIHHNAGA